MDASPSLFFFLSLGIVYLGASGLYIVSSVLSRKPAEPPAATTAPRLKAEARRAEAIAREKSKAVFWTPLFTGIVVSFIAVLIAVIVTYAALNASSYDPYAVLGLALGASDKDIGALHSPSASLRLAETDSASTYLRALGGFAGSAYRKLSSLYHPDKPTGDAKRFQDIARAYEGELSLRACLRFLLGYLHGPVPSPRSSSYGPVFDFFSVHACAVLANPALKMKYDMFGVTASGGERSISTALPSWMSEGVGQWALAATYGVVLLGVIPFLMILFSSKQRPAAAK
jgi:hypothetical protein